MFFEQYSHEPYIAVLRFWAAGGASAEKANRIPEMRVQGEAALAIMNEHLRLRDFFVGERYSIADISLFAYTHVAHEGSFDLSRHPELVTWIDRVQNQAGHIPITRG